MDLLISNLLEDFNKKCLKSRKLVLEKVQQNSVSFYNFFDTYLNDCTLTIMIAPDSKAFYISIIGNVNECQLNLIRKFQKEHFPNYLTMENDIMKR
jgi:hypothetical protein